jgi:hypothetical protein
MSLWSKLFGPKVTKRSSFPIADEVATLHTNRHAILTPAPDLTTASDSRGPEIDRLIEELIQIGRARKFLTTQAGREFNAAFRNIRACEIGESLNEKGGMGLMQFAVYRVRDVLGGIEARHLEMAWGGIGEWLG